MNENQSSRTWGLAKDRTKEILFQNPCGAYCGLVHKNLGDKKPSLPCLTVKTYYSKHSTVFSNRNYSKVINLLECNFSNCLSYSLENFFSITNFLLLNANPFLRCILFRVYIFLLRKKKLFETSDFYTGMMNFRNCSYGLLY